MTARTSPPFRADHVGSLLRPARLAEARGRRKTGEISAEDCRAVEDECIREVVAMQESVGLKSVTDGEFRRDWWHLDFLAGFDGIEIWDARRLQSFSSGEHPPINRAVGKVGRSAGIFTDAFGFLRDATTRTAKLTIPGPSLMHMRGGREGIDAVIYPDLDEFWADLCAAYRAEISELYDLGCRYLQIDDVSFAYLCDANMRRMFVERGDEPDATVALYARLINDVLLDRPDDLVVTTHMCRGNFRSSWVAQGGYEPVAETVFGGLAVDGFFLEYDSERAGGFEPLRFVPEEKIVVLGLVTSKTGELEDSDEIRRRIDEATRFVPLERLCLSPQCGFSSTHHGNLLDGDAQRRKLGLIVELANRIWG